MRLEVGGWGVHVEDAGAGEPAAVLVHSSGMTGRQWRRLAERLAPTRRVLVPDLAGYGRSSPFVAPAFDVAEDVAIVAATARAAGGPVHLVGHSYGGLLALLAVATGAVEARSVAVYEPVAFGVLRSTGDAEGLADLDRVGPGFFAEELEGTAAWCALFVDFWGGEGAFARMSAEAQGAFTASARKTFHEVRALMADVTPLATFARVAAPTLLLTGEASPLCARRVVAHLGAALADAEVAVVPGAGHMGPLTHAAVVGERVAAHLASVDATVGACVAGSR
jgi:pimeloyl-ACP methyl ester carboxylesterase